MKHMTQDQTELALSAFVGEVEAIANGHDDGRDLELVTAELFDAHPLTNVLIATSAYVIPRY